MTIKPFDGELDEPIGVKPFDGELDDTARQPLPIDVTPSNAGGGRGTLGAPQTAAEAQQRVPAPRRGGVRSEVRPYGAGDERVVAPPAVPTGGSVFDRAAARGDEIPEPPLTDEAMQWQSLSPAKQQEIQARQRYAEGFANAPEARPASVASNMGAAVREFTDNPVARGAVAGLSQLGQVGTGLVRAGADAVGAEGVSDFARGAAGQAAEVAGGSMQGLRGNDRLAADITSSIVNSAPAVALGTVGGPALRTLFAQSAAADYAETGNLAHAGMMGAAEALGERFGFAEQIKLLKGALRGMPTDDVAKVLGNMLAKEIPGEQATTAMQFLIDKAGPGARNPNATFEDYLKQAGQTLEVTIGQTAVMGGGPAAISTTRNEMARADAATERSAMNPAERAAADQGFLRPTQQRKAAVDRLDDFAAVHGVSSKAVKALKERADGMPLAEVPGFFKRAIAALSRRGLVGRPVGDVELAALDEQPPTSAQAEAPQQPAVPEPEAPAGSLAIEAPELLAEPERTPIDDGAHIAATSPENDLAEPTEAQKQAGNYKVGRARIAGMDISIENPQGSMRRGVDADGKPWETEMRSHYGYFRGTTAPDGDKLDVFVKPGTADDFDGPVFVIDQIDPKTGKFDEAKVMLGYADQAEAEAAYRAHYDAGWQGLGAITALPMGAFRAWATSRETRKPIGKLAQPAQPALRDEPTGLADETPINVGAPGPSEEAAPVAESSGAPAPAPAPAGFVSAPDGYRVRIDQHKRGSNVLDPTADVGAFTYEVKKGDDDLNALTMVLNKDGKLVPAKSVLDDNTSNGTAWVPPSADAAAQVRSLLEERAQTKVGSTERKAVDMRIAEAVKGSGAAPAEQPRVIARAGRTPKATTPIELRANPDGTLTPFMDGEPMADYDSGRPIVLPADVTDLAAKQAIRAAGAVSNKTNFFKPDAKDAAAPAQDTGVGGVVRGDTAPAAAAPRTLTVEGRASDGKPILAGDVFGTASGRRTTPYPKQKGEKHASQWLIDNAVAEAKSRGDDFNVTVFSGEKPLKGGDLPAASRDSMLEYLFGEQPAVPRPFLKPLNPASAAPAGSVAATSTKESTDGQERLQDGRRQEALTPVESQAAAGRGGPAAAKSRLTPLDDERLAQDDFRTALEQASADIGWTQRGGQLIRSGVAEAGEGNGEGGRAGAVVGRTQWLGPELWAQKPEPIGEDEARAAIARALAGEPMTAKQKRFVQYVLERETDRVMLDRENAAEAEAERAAIMAEAGIGEMGMQSLDDSDIPFDYRPEASNGSTQGSAQGQDAGEAGRAEEAQPGEVRAPDDARSQEARTDEAEGLTAPTPESLRDQAERRERADAADRAEQKRLADKAKADAELGDFTLTGSDSARDRAAAAGQSSLFDAPAEPAPPAAETTQTLDGMDLMPASEEAFAEALGAPGVRAQVTGEDERYTAMFHPTDPKVSLPQVTAKNPRPKGIEFISPAEAKKRLDGWKAEAERQGKENLSRNAMRTVISLFDVSGVIAQPWVEAGYNVVSYDLQTGADINEFNAENLLEQHGNDEVWAILAQPPCTDYASSGAQWWKDKDADGRTEASNELVRQTLRTIELFRPAVWVMENPIGRIATQNKLPEPTLVMDPWHYGDPYTKRTQLWGRFDPNLPQAPVEPTEGSKIHRMSSSAKNERSLTPEGFAYAFFMANNAESMPLGARLAQEFAGVERALFDRAVAAGNDDYAIRTAIEDAYYDNDLETVRDELAKLAGPAPSLDKPIAKVDTDTINRLLKETADMPERRAADAAVRTVVASQETGKTGALRIDGDPVVIGEMLRSSGIAFSKRAGGVSVVPSKVEQARKAVVSEKWEFPGGLLIQQTLDGNATATYPNPGAGSTIKALKHDSLIGWLSKVHDEVEGLKAGHFAKIAGIEAASSKETPPPEPAQAKAVQPVAEPGDAGPTPAPEAASPRSTPTAAPASRFGAFKAAMTKLYDGELSIDDYRAAYRAVRDGADAVRAELGKLTKDELTRTFGIMRDGKKDELVGIAYDSMVDRFSLGKSYGPNSYGMTRGGYENYLRLKAEALDALVEGQTPDDLATFAKEVAARREEAAQQRAARAKAIADPKTIPEFRAYLEHHMREGKTNREARMSLTPEQRALMDSLWAKETRSRRKDKQDEQRTAVRVAGQTVDGQIIATKHTKKGHDLFVVRLAERVSREDYETLNTGAKKIGGYYSSYRGGGAIPGFQFTTREQAEAFVKLAGGDASEAKAAAQERRDAFADDRSQTAAQRLTEMADALEERAEESLGRERKANTERRARFAAAAEAEAQSQKALARTMRNIAGAIEAGKAEFLDRVRQKVQVEMLSGMVRRAHDDQLRAKYPNYSDFERHKGEAPTAEAADFAEFPSYTAYRSDLAGLGRQLLEVEGTKLLGQRLMKVADDVSDAYIAFAKEPGNLFKLSAFGVRRGDEMRTAIFPDKATAERSLSRSGLAGKGIVFQEKRGVNRIILSPSEAIKRGIWKGDGDKRITLTEEFGAELVAKMGKAARRGAKVSVPWQFETAHDRLKALARMGIETPAEMRAALREFIGLREQAAAPDKVKQLERAMVGKKNDGFDFFPTPEGVADEMVETAGLEPGMRVLEPSAGMGHIAERIRDAGVEPDVGEIASDRRELLEAKGFNLVARDFMDLKEGGYDRILMNPPFSDGRDIAHVRHAYELLKPGGRVVAIMGEGAFSQSFKRAEEFREWLESVGGTEEKLPEGTFLDPSLPVNTGANARMVVIDKGEDVRFSRRAEAPAPVFYSELARHVERSPMNAGQPSAWLAWLKGLPAKGVKPDEIAWTGIEDWLGLHTGKVTKQQVSEFLSANGVRVEETVLGGPGVTSTQDRLAVELDALGWSVTDEGFVRRSDDALFYFDGDWITDEDDAAPMPANVREKVQAYAALQDGDTLQRGEREPRYGQYTLPGGQNYREVLLTLPEKDKITTKRVASPAGWGDTDGGNVGIERSGDTGADYRSGHWDQPNILAHIRVNDRRAPRPGVDLNEIGERIRVAAGAKSQGSLGNGAPEMAVRKGAVTEQEARWYSHHRGFLNVPTEDPTQRVLFVEEIQSDFGQATKKQRGAIAKAVDSDFNGIVERMKKAGVLTVECD